MVSRGSRLGGRRHSGGDDDLQPQSTVRPDGPDSTQAPTVTGAEKWMRLGGLCAWTGLLSSSGGVGGPTGGGDLAIIWPNAAIAQRWNYDTSPGCQR
jgi:hypothetical protein